MIDTDYDYLRALVLNRDDHKCTECGTIEQLHVHHIIPKYLGGSNNPDNLITLCAACHAIRHPSLQISLARSFIEKWALRLACWLDSTGNISEDISLISGALRVIGKEKLREGQLEIILAALKGKSMLVIRPTGFGKTICFQIPSLLRDGTSYVISPLKALMYDQVSGLQRSRIPGTFINSDLTHAEKNKRYELLAKKAFKFLYITPERFNPALVDMKEIELLSKQKTSYLVVDEAHCIDRWGDDFRPSYNQIAEIRKQIGNPPVLAFTATAGIKAQKRILDSLGAQDAEIFVSDVDRKNIGLIRIDTSYAEERFRIIRKLISNTKGKCLIFAPTLRIGEHIKAGLSQINMDIPFYHGKLPGHQRDFLLGQITGKIQPELNNLICTNAFGMGIDIPNIRLVIHWTQPESVEDYLQEFGRAGRDGLPSLAVIFYSVKDKELRLFMARKTAEKAGNQSGNSFEIFKRKKYAIEAMYSILSRRNSCFRKQLICYFQEKRPQTKPWSIIILEWVFGSRMKIKEADFCCDACNPKKVAKMI